MILIEVHSGHGPLSWGAHRMFMGLAHAGYTVYAKEPNTYGCSGGCIEYAFVRTDIPGAPVGHGIDFLGLP